MKKITKTYRVLIYAFLLATVLLAGVYAGFRSDYVQRHLVVHLNKQLSALLGNPARIQGVDIALLDGLVLDGLVLLDSQADTLVATRKLTARLRYFDFDQNKLVLRRIDIDGLHFQYLADTTGRSNLDELLDRFASDSPPDTTASAPFALECRSFRIGNSRVVYRVGNAPALAGQMNFDYLRLDSLTLHLSALELVGDSVLFSLDRLAFVEQSGLELDSLRARFNVSPKGIFLDSLLFKTELSRLELPRLHLATQSWDSYSDFVGQVALSVAIAHGSVFHLADAGRVLGNDMPIRKPIRLSGQIDGPLSSFTLTDFQVAFGRESVVKLSGNSFGLPDLPNTFWNISVDRLHGNMADVAYLLADMGTSLPAEAKRMGSFDFSGKLAGLTFDLVADLDLDAWYGSVSTDMKVSQLSPYEYMLTGQMAVRKLDLGYLLADTTLGTLDLRDTVQLTYDTRGRFALRNRGKIDSVHYGGYNYHNIRLVGQLENQHFDGDISVDDPNLDFWLRGDIDLDAKVPSFRFEARSRNIDFAALGFDPSNKRSSINFAMRSELAGSHLDNISGLLAFDTLCYTNDNGHVPFDFLELRVSQDQSYKTMILSSDYFAAKVDGDFSFSTLDKALMRTVYHFFPVLALDTKKGNADGLMSDNVLINKDYNQLDTLQDFQFNLQLGQLNRVVQLFAPDVHIANSTYCAGSFNSAQQVLKVNFESDSIAIGTQFIDQPKVSIDIQDTYLVANASVRSISLSEGMAVRNIKTFAQAQADDNRLSLVLDWNNRADTLNFAGTLNLDLEALQSYETGNLNYVVQMNQSQITIDQAQWAIDDARLTMDTTSVRFEQFQFSSGQQSIGIDGVVSEMPKDKLFVNIENFDLRALNPLLASASTTLAGTMSGNTELSNLLQTPMVLAKDSIEHFTLNGDDIGNLYFTTAWEGDHKRLNLDLSLVSRLMNRNTFSIIGSIYPEQSSMDFDLELFKFELSPLQGFVAGIVSDLKGSVSGNMKIDGTFDAPRIDGLFGLRRVSATIDYLKTNYAIQEDEIRVNNRRIEFKDAIVKDPRGQTAKLDVLVRHNFFDDLNLDIYLDALNFQVLNTTELDNELFYGSAFVTGDVKVSGPVENMQIEVQAKSERNTKINLPLSSTGSVSEFNFIEFQKGFSSQTVEGDQSNEYKVDLSGMRIKLNLDVTEDAEMQIIMDKKVGDVIRAAGEGALTIDLDTKGDFLMFGEYVILRGDYLFTLKNLINKKFVVEKGGSIRWNGDPLNAILDLNAVYKLKKIPLKDFYFQDESYKEKKVPVDCKLAMKGSLEKPSIGFNLHIDDPDTRINDDFRKLTEEEMNKQFLSLLVMNRFQPLYGGADQAVAGNSDVLGSNATELLSNQLSVWLSQMSDAFDMDVKYRMGDGQTQSELEVGVSTELLNDRLAIQVSGNMNMGQNQAAAAGQMPNNDFEGDYEMSYKLTRNGKTRLKYFGRANQIISYQRIPFMQGLGMLYREDFDTFGELFRRYGAALRPKETQIEDDPNNKAPRKNSPPAKPEILQPSTKPDEEPDN